MIFIFIENFVIRFHTFISIILWTIEAVLIFFVLLNIFSSSSILINKNRHYIKIINKGFLKLLKKYSFGLSLDIWILFIAAWISLIACVYAYIHGLNLTNFDALSRMNIARKIIDNLNPGLGQFGTVWPFLPQLIMMPFVVITPLWHTGIAGMIMSAPAFIISGYLMYKIIFDITHSKYIAIIGFLIFSTNINLLLLQTMAMSESLFIALILGAMYNLICWQKDPIRRLLPLIYAGICLSGACLVRYEGIPFSLAAIFVVALIVFFAEHNLKTTEGITTLFATIALFGLFIWCLYSAMIFGDPLYWEKVYTGQTSIISSDVRNSSREKVKIPFSTNFKNVESKSEAYITAIAELSGIPIFIFGTIGCIGYFFYLKKSKIQNSLVLLLPLSIVGFMFVTFYKSSLPIIAPPLTIKNIMNFKTTFITEFNIRYGILLWPFIVMMTAWLFSRNNILKNFAVFALVINIFTPLYHGAFLIYQLPLVWGKGSAIYTKEYPGRDWLKKHYTGGLILISALKHDPIMFQLGYPYKTFIHEGTGKYWITSRSHPEVYAQWIFMADPKDITGGAAAGEKDPVTLNLEKDTTLKKYFIERYNDGYIDIYQRRGQ